MKRAASVFCVLALAFMLCSCSVVRLAVDVAQAARQSRIDARNPGGGHKNYWDEIPDTIPEFKYGTRDGRFSYKTTDKKSISYMMQYKGVTKQDIDDYAKALEAAGFDVTITEDDMSYSVMAMPEDQSTLPPDYWSDPESMPNPDDMPFPTPWISADLDTSDGSCLVSVDLANSSSK